MLVLRSHILFDSFCRRLLWVELAKNCTKLCLFAHRKLLYSLVQHYIMLPHECMRDPLFCGVVGLTTTTTTVCLMVRLRTNSPLGRRHKFALFKYYLNTVVLPLKAVTMPKIDSFSRLDWPRKSAAMISIYLLPKNRWLHPT